MLFERFRDLGGSTSRINAMTFSPFERLLASGDDKGGVKVWDVTTGRTRFSLQFDGSVSAITWDTVKRSRIFVGLGNGSVVVVDNFSVRSLLVSCCTCSPPQPHQLPGRTVKTGATGAPVCTMSVSPKSLLAISIGPEVHVAHEIRPGKSCIVRKVDCRLRA
jgi:WD40 repeat protein